MSELPQPEETTVATFAEDTATWQLETESKKLQKNYNEQLVKLNEAKSVHVDFTNKRCQNIPITINDSHTSLRHNEIPWHDAGSQAALEGTCKKKREELGLKYKKMYWLMGRRSALSIHNKLMLYKQY
jgi:hypothetical protein